MPTRKIILIAFLLVIEAAFGGRVFSKSFMYKGSHLTTVDGHQAKAPSKDFNRQIFLKFSNNAASESAYKSYCLGFLFLFTDQQALKLSGRIIEVAAILLIASGFAIFGKILNRPPGNFKLGWHISAAVLHRWSLIHSLKINKALVGRLGSLILEKESQLQERDRQLLEKEFLLREKELLLKEMHHRVKNNLQIVINLLANQSTLLQSKDATDVLNKSRQRVQAIALIHQKLYHDTRGTIINMQAYTTSLLEDIDDCFSVSGRSIVFEKNIEPIELGIEQAVPLGLIINEAITNAIKYAFSEEGGIIWIALHKTEESSVLLAITDNGKGLPVDVDAKSARSQGMKMMKGLSSQLHGTLRVVNDHGVKLSLKFPVPGNALIEATA